MKAASNQRVSSNAGRDNEKVLAEFAYQPAAEGKRQNGEVKGASKAEVMHLLLTSRVTMPGLSVSAAQSCHPGPLSPLTGLVLRSVAHCVNLLLVEHVLPSQATGPVSIPCMHTPSTSA